MDNWRKKGYNYNQELPRLKYHNYYRKPPPGGNSNWQQGVPQWEKSFVTTIGGMPWKNFMEAKAYTHLYDNIIKWNDSAGEEAFQTAKNNYHAKIHGPSYEIKPHNPDLYIDQIDWNANVDRNLILDLDSDYVGPDSDSDHDREPVVIFGDALPDPYKNYSSPGWGDENKSVDCWNKIPEGCNNNNGINYDDYVNKWDVDFGGNDSQWFSNENDNKAHGDQGWNNEKGWNKNNNNCYGNVNNEGGMYKSWRFNNGNRRNPVAQAHGSQWVHRVHP